VSFGEAVRSVFAKYATFDGRATRSEYWWFQLFNVLVVLAAYAVIVAIVLTGRNSVTIAVAAIAGFGLLIYVLGTFIPNLAVTVRRLHDTNKSGWWLLIGFVPYIGAIVLLVFLVLPSDRDVNNFGPPYGMTGDIRVVNYRAPAPTETWARYTEDAQRAAANGYEPVSQQWRRDGLGDYLEVIYHPTSQLQWQAQSGWLNPSNAAGAGGNPLDGPPPDRSGSA
jgi:uncharacterized membrane protein YhaH (DUF805 family)